MSRRRRRDPATRAFRIAQGEALERIRTTDVRRPVHVTASGLRLELEGEPARVAVAVVRRARNVAAFHASLHPRRLSSSWP